MSASKFFKTAGIAIVFMIAASSCKQRGGGANDPKQRLTDYIAQSFAVKDVSDRVKLVGYLTGGAKNRLIAWSDEQFRQAFLDTKRQFIKLAIRDVKDVSGTEANVTYELTYSDASKGSEARVTNKRMSEMVLQDGKWLIREVHNIKELIEYKNEMSLP